MKVYKDITIPEKTSKVLVLRKCDICGLESTNASYNESEWGMSGKEEDNIRETKIKITIEHNQGNHWPDTNSGSGEEHEIDLCPECFKYKLIPWINGQTQGPGIQTEEWDY